MTVSLLEAQSIVRSYEVRRGLFARPTSVRAVDGVSLSLRRGSTLGLVGESGSGKSTTGRLVLGLEKVDGGQVLFEGSPLPAPGTKPWRRLRTRMQMVFQDPLGALDRRLPVLAQVREPLDIHHIGTPAERLEQARALLASVGLAASHGARYPHELSGGQRQRVVIARALASKPELVVCDEPVSALDVSIQAQVLNLLVDLQQDLDLTLLFISHDLRVVRQVSRRIAVMYLGRIVEEGPTDEVLADPAHPYTQALVSAAPAMRAGPRERIVLTGDPPSPAFRPSGCAFHPRCPVALPQCRADDPLLSSVGADRLAACHRLPTTGPSPARAPEGI